MMLTRFTNLIRPVTLVVAIAGVLLADMLAGCSRFGETGATAGIRQTKFPGQYTAGGETSGRIMARSAGAAKTARLTDSATRSSQESTRGQAPSGSVAGTPGIPEGSGGTTSGAEMGGTTPGAAATKVAPPSGGGNPAIPAHITGK